MKEETLAKAIKYYIRIGLVYGGIRSVYWLGNLNDKTYDYYKKDYVTHTPTTKTMLGYAFMNGAISQMFWPLCMLSDFSVYEKSKMGVRDITPPFPFDSLHWKK